MTMLFSLLCSNTIQSREFRVHRAGSQLKIVATSEQNVIVKIVTFYSSVVNIPFPLTSTTLRLVSPWSAGIGLDLQLESASNSRS